MKNLNFLWKGMICLFVMSILFTACQKETPEVEQPTMQEVDEVMSIVTAPDGLIEDDAIAWAQNLAEEDFAEYSQSQEESDVIESRWCTAWQNDGIYQDTSGCWCCVDGYGCGWYCVQRCDIQVRWCGGWSGGQYVVIKYTRYVNCWC